MLAVEFKEEKPVQLTFSDLSLGDLFTFPDKRGVLIVTTSIGGVVLKPPAPLTRSLKVGEFLRVSDEAKVIRLDGVMEVKPA